MISCLDNYCMRPSSHLTPRGSHCSIDRDLSEEELLMSPYTPPYPEDQLRKDDPSRGQETQKKKEANKVTVHRERTELKEKRSVKKQASAIQEKDQQISRLLLEVRMLSKEINKMHRDRDRSSNCQAVKQGQEKWLDRDMCQAKEAQQKQQQQKFLQRNNLELYEHLKEQKHFNRLLLSKVNSLSVINVTQAHQIKEQERRIKEMNRENVRLMRAVGECMTKEREEMKIIRTVHKALSKSSKRSLSESRSESYRKQERRGDADKIERKENFNVSEQIERILASKLNLADYRNIS